MPVMPAAKEGTVPDTADDLIGNNLQVFVSKTFEALRHEVWPEAINRVVHASCEVVDHQQGLVSVAFIGRSGTAATNALVRRPPEGSVPPYDRLERKHEAIRELIRDICPTCCQCLKTSCGARQGHRRGR